MAVCVDCGRLQWKAEPEDYERSVDTVVGRVAPQRSVGILLRIQNEVEGVIDFSCFLRLFDLLLDFGSDAPAIPHLFDVIRWLLMIKDRETQTNDNQLQEVAMTDA